MGEGRTTPADFKLWLLRPGDTDLPLSHARSVDLVLASLHPALDGDDRLSLLLGTLVREHADLHQDLSALWSEFAGATPASRLLPDQFSALVDDCLTMIPAVAALDEPRHADAARAALQFARSVNQRRNEMVHERWVSAQHFYLFSGSDHPEKPEPDDDSFIRQKLPRKSRPNSPEPPRIADTAVHLREVALLVVDTILAGTRLGALLRLLREDPAVRFGIYAWSDVERDELLLGAYRGTVVEEWSP